MCTSIVLFTAALPAQPLIVTAGSTQLPPGRAVSVELAPTQPGEFSTVSVKLAARVAAVPVPTTVIVYVPGAVVALVVSVRVLVPPSEPIVLGVKVAVAPA